ncbi:MAG: Hint domain-containing protein, partial [Acetobacteraceae bacterium]
LNCRRMRCWRGYYSAGVDGNDNLAGIEHVLGSNFADTLIAGRAIQFLYGSDGADSMVGGSASFQRLYGDDGNDTLVGNAFQPYLFGGAGDDSLVGGTVGGNFILGGGGNDTLISRSENFELRGEDGNDSLQGSSAADQIIGGADNDTLSGGGGADAIIGNDGMDFADYGFATAGIVASFDSNEGVLIGDDYSYLYDIEGLIGSNFDDNIVGYVAANTLLGGNGDDTLSGSGGNDWLDFGAGNERLLRSGSESGNDTLIGGLGNDTLDLGSNWSYLSASGGFSLYRDDADTIWAQGWEQVVCFAKGTRIVTPAGEVEVENLRAGDMVLAMRNGQAGFEALRWVGFMDIAVPRNAAMAAKTAPILIKAGGIAPGMPARDLRVSPDHAMEIDGHLIPAKHLVNGSSIIQEIWCKRVRYFHLELEAHGLLLSEGTWSESYLDDGNRHAFNNAALTGLFLDFEAGRSKGQYDHLACLPVLRQGLKLDEIHGRIALRAGALLRTVG